MLAKKTAVQGPILTSKQAPSTGGLPNPRDTHKSLPTDFFSRNYCQELAHNELFAYVPKVKADPSLQTALRNIFTTKAPLGAGHSNAITLWVYAGYALNNLDLDGVESIAFADLSGATITNVIFSVRHFMDIEGVSFVGATLDNVHIINSNPRLARWGIPQSMGLENMNQLLDDEHGYKCTEKNYIGDIYFSYLSPLQTYQIIVFKSYPEFFGLNLYQVYNYHLIELHNLRMIHNTGLVTCFLGKVGWKLRFIPDEDPSFSPNEHDAALQSREGYKPYFSPDEELVVTDERNKKLSFTIYKLSDQTVRNKDHENISRKVHFEIIPIKKGNYIPSITTFSPDSQKLAVAYVDPDLESGPVPFLGNMIIQIFNTRTWKVEVVTKSELVHNNSIEFFDNDTFMYLSAVDKTGRENRLNILRRVARSGFMKTKFSWMQHALIPLDEQYAIELQVYPSTNRIGIQYKCNELVFFTFYHFTENELKKIIVYPRRFQKHIRNIHPTGKYIVTEVSRGKPNLKIFSVDTGATVHYIRINWPRSGDHIEFTPNGKAISITRLKEPTIEWFHEEQYILTIPSEYVLNRVLYSSFEHNFDKENVKVMLPTESVFFNKLTFAHLYQEKFQRFQDLYTHKEHTKSLGNQLQQEISRRKESQRSTKEPGSQTKSLTDQLQQEIARRKQAPKKSTKEPVRLPAPSKNPPNTSESSHCSHLSDSNAGPYIKKYLSRYSKYFVCSEESILSLMVKHEPNNFKSWSDKDFFTNHIFLYNYLMIIRPSVESLCHYIKCHSILVDNHKLLKMKLIEEKIPQMQSVSLCDSYLEVLKLRNENEISKEKLEAAYLQLLSYGDVIIEEGYLCYFKLYFTEIFEDLKNQGIILIESEKSYLLYFHTWPELIEELRLRQPRLPEKFNLENPSCFDYINLKYYIIVSQFNKRIHNNPYRAISPLNTEIQNNITERFFTELNVCQAIFQAFNKACHERLKEAKDIFVRAQDLMSIIAKIDFSLESESPSHSEHNHKEEENQMKTQDSTAGEVNLSKERAIEQPGKASPPPIPPKPNIQSLQKLKGEWGRRTANATHASSSNLDMANKFKNK